MEKEDDRVTLLTSCQESIQKFIAIILSYLDHDSLRNAQKVCNAWRIVVREKKLWEKFYYRNSSSPEWQKMQQILKVRDSLSFPSKNQNNYYEKLSCMIGDSIMKLERNWMHGTYVSSTYSMNEASRSTNILSMNDRWIARAQSNGRIGIRNRWQPEEEHEAEFFPNKNIPINANQYPIIESIQCNDDFFVAIGLVDTRKILFVLDVKRHLEPTLLRCSAWRVIENSATKLEFIFDSKNCIRLNGNLLLLCGRKVSDSSTMVNLMNPKERKNIFQNETVPSRVGVLFDFAVDEWRVVLFFGRKENPRLQRIDRYLLQIRNSITFSLLQSFVVPAVQSGLCHFDYSCGFIVTGSDDSPIRVWNAIEGTCDGSFPHDEDNLSGLRIVANRLILTCDRRGVVKLWNMQAAVNPDTRDDYSSLLVKKFDPPIPPYWSFRRVKTLAMVVDEFQIAFVLQYDSKSPLLHIIDFIADVQSEKERIQPARKRRANT